MMSGSALMGMMKALEVMLKCMETGGIADRPDLLVGIEGITQLVGYAPCHWAPRVLRQFEKLRRPLGDIASTLALKRWNAWLHCDTLFLFCFLVYGAVM
jgi:hypothetical protein